MSRAVINGVLGGMLTLLVGIPLLAAGVVLPDGALRQRDTRYHDNGAIERAYLEQPVAIQGRTYEGWCWFDDDGFLHQGVLAEDTPLGDFTLPAGTTMLLDADRPERIMTWLPHDLTVAGLPVIGGGKVDASFDPTGQLRFAFLQHDIVVQAIPCEGGVFTPVEFDADGRLIRCTLDDPAFIAGTEYDAGSELWFAEDGHVSMVVMHPWWKRLGRDIMDVVF